MIATEWKKNDMIQFRCDEASADILTWLQKEFKLKPASAIRFALVHLNFALDRAHRGGPGAQEAYRAIAATRDVIEKFRLDEENRSRRPKKSR